MPSDPSSAPSPPLRTGAAAGVRHLTATSHLAFSSTKPTPPFAEHATCPKSRCAFDASKCELQSVDACTMSAALEARGRTGDAGSDKDEGGGGGAGCFAGIVGIERTLCLVLVWGHDHPRRVPYIIMITPHPVLMREWGACPLGLRLLVVAVPAAVDWHRHVPCVGCLCPHNAAHPPRSPDARQNRESGVEFLDDLRSARGKTETAFLLLLRVNDLARALRARQTTWDGRCGGVQ
ncbi:hypothetical protein B0H14DRAFT_3879730 [Mycena olivaceomarginata]|nr:hypothetical protein B0H14DRAFT_3879730 [Mycena olivaceomarginata]